MNIEAVPGMVVQECSHAPMLHTPRQLEGGPRPAELHHDPGCIKPAAWQASRAKNRMAGG